MEEEDCERKECLVVMAKLAEQCERYNDMAQNMKTLTELGDDLSNEERNLLSVAYKNVVGSKRCAVRCIANHGQHPVHGNATECNRFRKYLSKVENELDDVCNEVLVLYPILTP